MKIVIFCGGFGTRMWPASTKSNPKQFAPILNGKSFYRLTLDRFEKRFDTKDIFISTEIRYKDIAMSQAQELPVENFIFEPERRDTMAAIGLVLAKLKTTGDETVFFSWSDHIIDQEDTFLDAVELSLSLTNQTGFPVSINQPALYPTTQNGWVKLGAKKEKKGEFEVFEIDDFVEKPTSSIAQKLFRSKEYLVHTGYGSWPVNFLWNEYQKNAPAAFSVLEKICEEIGSGSSEIRNLYGQIEKQSVDYAVFEKIPKGQRLTISAKFGWKDAGTWQLLFDALSRDNQTVNLSGVNLVEISSSGNLVSTSNTKVVSLVGVTGVAVIEINGAILILDLTKSAEVKDLYNSLESLYPESVS